MIKKWREICGKQGGSSWWIKYLSGEFGKDQIVKGLEGCAKVLGVFDLVLKALGSCWFWASQLHD